VNSDPESSDATEPDRDPTSATPPSEWEDPPPPPPTALPLILGVVACVTPTIAFRAGGTSLWIFMAIGVTVSASIALYLLWADGMLVAVLRPRGLDLSWGVAFAAALLLAFVMGFNTWVAPPHEIGGLLRQCTMDGPRVPRAGDGLVQRFFEWVRGQTCLGYARTLHIPLSLRGGAVIVIAALEEIAWRGGVQQSLSERLGSTRGWLAATVLYALAHAATGVVLLPAVALVAGLAWGGLYRYRGRLGSSIASHVTFSYFLFHAMPLVVFR